MWSSHVAPWLDPDVQAREVCSAANLFVEPQTTRVTR